MTPTTPVATATPPVPVGVVPGDGWELHGTKDNETWVIPVVAWLVFPDGIGVPLAVQHGRLQPADTTVEKRKLRHPREQGRGRPT